MIHLKNLESDEQIMLVIRRHWVIYLILGGYFFIGLFLILGMYLIIGISLTTHFFVIIFLLIFMPFMYILWLDHELDMYVITNKRIIGIDQISVFNRMVSECSIHHIQEVNSTTKGFFANVFNYGTLSIQTAGTTTTMYMNMCPDAIQTARKILSIVDSTQS